MLVTINIDRSSVHLISILREDGHRLSITRNLIVSFNVKDSDASDDVVAMYENVPGVNSIKVTDDEEAGQVCTLQPGVGSLYGDWVAGHRRSADVSEYVKSGWSGIQRVGPICNVVLAWLKSQLG